MIFNWLAQFGPLMPVIVPAFVVLVISCLATEFLCRRMGIDGAMTQHQATALVAAIAALSALVLIETPWCARWLEGI